ncbi:MAG: AI-2E family transporter [Pyrinomonadaceae bacterium]
MADLKIQPRWIALGAVAIICLYLCWLMLEPFLGVLLWAVVLVIVFLPVHRRIEARTQSPGWSAVISCLLVVVMVLLPLSLLALAVVREVTGFAQNLQANMDSFFDPNSPLTGKYLRWLGQYIDIDQLRTQRFVVERIRGMSGVILNRTLGVVGGLVGVVLEIFFVIFTMYYLFRDRVKLSAGLADALPLDRRQAREIFARTRDVISASVYGVVVIATIQGTLGGLAFWFLGLPSPLLWGVVMILLSMIPMVGSFVVWVPAALFLLASGHWVKALVLTIIGFLVIGTIDNVLRPKLVGEKTRLHELLIFFSVLGGLQVFGILGLVLGPVVVAVTIALIDIFRHAERRPAGTPTIEDKPALLEEQNALRNVPEQKELLGQS